MGKDKILLDGKTLTVEKIIKIARDGIKVELPENIKRKIYNDRKKLEKQLRDKPDIPIYGTNVLHGDLKDSKIDTNIFKMYQIKYIKSHNCGTGQPLPVEWVRAIMVIRLNSFALGLSGMKLDTCQLLIDMLNKRVTPWVLEEGSVGASGDLVPLAMIGATMIGLEEAKAYVGLPSLQSPSLKTAKEAFIETGLFHVVLGPKEAMGLTNGANFIAGLGSFALIEAENLLKNASIAVSLSLEAIRGEKKAFDTLINEDSSRHEGQIIIANQIRALLKNSKRCSIEAQIIPFNNKHKAKERVQDRYSFRCAPQVHGATYEAIDKLRKTIQVEINSATDNPLFNFNKTEKVITSKGKKKISILYASGGNFHGQPLASVIDYVKITLTSLGLISDKRTFSLLDENLNFGLNADLAINANKKADGGLMITQYAGAGRAAENRVLSTPASIMSISTSANQEDFVSMGSIGALHLHKIIKNLTTIIAVEILCAHRALQLPINKKKLNKHNLNILGDGTKKVFEYLNKVLPPVKEDTYLRTEIEKVINLIKSGSLIRIVKGFL